MTKLEKVMQGLECCTNGVNNVPRCEDCPYRGFDDTCAKLDELHDDALEMLKEREPRVLTLKEALSQSWDYCYIEAEVRPRSKMIETLCGTHRLYCTTSIVLERQTRGDKEYGKTWRCWTARPTEEQREATPWDEPPKEGDSE